MTHRIRIGMVMATKDGDDLCYSSDPRDNEGTLCGAIFRGSCTHVVENYSEEI